MSVLLLRLQTPRELAKWKALTRLWSTELLCCQGEQPFQDHVLILMSAASRLSRSPQDSVVPLRNCLRAASRNRLDGSRSTTVRRTRSCCTCDVPSGLQKDNQQHVYAEEKIAALECFCAKHRRRETQRTGRLSVGAGRFTTIRHDIAFSADKKKETYTWRLSRETSSHLLAFSRWPVPLQSEHYRSTN